MRRRQLAIVSAFGAAVLCALAFPPSTGARAAQDSASCLHGANESPGQSARRREALMFTRHVNTAQANAKGYSPQADLPLKLAVPEGFEFKLVADAQAYSFSVVDTTDPCRFGFFSNEAGLIFKGEVIR